MNGSEFAELLPAMLPVLGTFALRLTGGQHEAKDLVQRTCVRGLELAHQLQPENSPLSWVFTIMHSIWLNEILARKVRNRWSTKWDDDLLQSVADSSVRALEEKAINGQTIAAVEQLPNAYQVLLRLIAEKLSFSEIAEILAVPVHTVMSRLSRASRALAKSLVHSNETYDQDGAFGEGAAL
jgi:RNA polymerase sigma-70 factor (ECF subfamily)